MEATKKDGMTWSPYLLSSLVLTLLKQKEGMKNRQKHITSGNYSIPLILLLADV